MRAIQTSGKRKMAIARATVTEGIGQVRINKKPINNIQPKLARLKLLEALTLFRGEDRLQNIRVDIKVGGGGAIAQCDAARIALTKALNEFLNKKRVTKRIREYDRTLLSGDSRRKEPKKWGGPSARTRFQKSYR